MRRVWLKGDFISKSRIGRPTTLSEAQEKDLSELIISRQKREFPMTVDTTMTMTTMMTPVKIGSGAWSAIVGHTSIAEDVRSGLSFVSFA